MVELELVLRERSLHGIEMKFNNLFLYHLASVVLKPTIEFPFLIQVIAPLTPIIRI